MRTISKTYEVYPLVELSAEAQDKAYYKWLESEDYGWTGENRETLKAFCDIFNVTCTRWEYDAYTYNFRFSTQHSESVEELKGQRLAVYIMNNYWNALFPSKQYWHNGKKRSSRIFNTDSCVLTGYYIDDEILEPVYTFLDKPNSNTTFLNLMNQCLEQFFTACRDDMQDRQSKECFTEESHNNEWEYLHNGSQFIN